MVVDRSTMSSVIGDSNSMSSCAACGKSGDNLKICTACRLVKYCNRECQISHRPKHKKECKKRAAELRRTGGSNTSSNSNVNEISEGISNVNISGSISASTTDQKMSTSYEQNCTSDDKLFADSPPKEDCPICLLPMPHTVGLFGVEIAYMPCCGKTLCYGCVKATEVEMEKGTMKRKCAFCRIPVHGSAKEYVERCQKRTQVGDAEAFYTLGVCYQQGKWGLPKDMNKAIEFLNRAADLGSCRAHSHIATLYINGEVVELDVDKAMHHFKLAAIGGHEEARHILGVWSRKEKPMEAIKHFVIAAKGGSDGALKRVGEVYKRGLVTKDEYASTLRSYQNVRNEMKSEQRTKAAELREQLSD